MPRWAMVIDLERCIGCGSCASMCAGGNRAATESGWRRVVHPRQSNEPTQPRLFVPLSCMHCEPAPCATVCPTEATLRRQDGIVDVDHRLCVGCGYCVVACPYGARTLAGDRNRQVADARGAGEDHDDPYAGTATKCNFCLPRVQEGIALGLRPGEDAAASPWCQVGCPAKAIQFGDRDRAEDAVAQLIGSDAAVSLSTHDGTATALRYQVDHHLGKVAPVLEISPPAMQRVWGWPVVTNFAFAGAGAGACLMGWMADAAPIVNLAAALLAVLGFVAVAFKSRHPSRNLNLLRGLPHSWMSWEVLAGILFIISASAGAFVRHPAIETAGAFAAAFLLTTQGLLVRGARAIPSWRIEWVPALFVFSGLASGSGVLILWNALGGAPMNPVFLAAAWVVVGAMLCVWLLFLARHLRIPALAPARSRLFQPRALALSIGVVHLLPLFAIALLIVGGAELSNGVQFVLALGSAFALIAGGIILKEMMLLRAGFLERIAFAAPGSGS